MFRWLRRALSNPTNGDRLYRPAPNSLNSQAARWARSPNNPNNPNSMLNPNNPVGYQQTQRRQHRAAAHRNATINRNNQRYR